MKRSSHVRRERPTTQVRTLTGSSAVDSCEVDVVHLDAVEDARAALPRDDALSRVADCLALLGAPTRLKMLLALQPTARGRRRELCVCDLAIVTGASKSLTSHQLRLLRAAGLVTVRRSGKLAYYRLAEGPALALLSHALELAFAQSGAQRSG